MKQSLHDYCRRNLWPSVVLPQSYLACQKIVELCMLFPKELKFKTLPFATLINEYFFPFYINYESAKLLMSVLNINKILVENLFVNNAHFD